MKSIMQTLITMAGAGQAATRSVRLKITSKFTTFPNSLRFRGQVPAARLDQGHLPEIEVFARALHSNVVLPLLRLFAITLQLPDEKYLVQQHTCDKKSEDYLRYVIYRKRTDEEHAASGYSQSIGHTDLGAVMLLFRQPVAGLQILGEDGIGRTSQPNPAPSRSILQTPSRS